MFEAKDVIADAVGAGLKLFAGYGRGDVVPWTLIEQAAGFDRGSSHWTQFSARVRRDFRKSHGVVLWPVNGVGLKLLTAHETLTVRSIARQRRAVRQMTRDVTELGSLPDRELTAHQRAMKYVKIQQSRTARGAVLASLRRGHMLDRPSSSGLPRVKPAVQSPAS